MLLPIGKRICLTVLAAPRNESSDGKRGADAKAGDHQYNKRLYPLQAGFLLITGADKTIRLSPNEIQIHFIPSLSFCQQTGSGFSEKKELLETKAFPFAS